jgi:hypothetical protein
MLDPNEIVMFSGRGNMTLRSAVREIMTEPPAKRQLVTLFRDKGKKPSLLDIGAVEILAELPDYKG